MLPVLLPDMTFYSLVAISHRWEGASRGEQTCNRLFGSPGAGLRHDFPSHLDEFCRRTRAAYGSADDISMKATVLPYFLRFRYLKVHDKALTLMRGATVEPLKFVLGLHPGPSGASMPFRACEECICTDNDTSGFAYWHRKHQLPGVYVCPDHEVPLLQSNIRIDGYGRSMFLMPDDIGLLSRTIDLSASQLPTLKRLSVLSAAVLESGLPGEYSAQVLQATYRHGLKQQGLLTTGGRVRAAEFIKWLHDRYKHIEYLDTFRRIVPDKYIEGMLRLVRKPRENFHTACHVLLIDALFGNWEMFKSVYEWERNMELPLVIVEKSPEIEVPPISENGLIAIELAKRFEKGEGSISALSRELGIDINTSMRWFGRLGLMDVQRRPRVLCKELREEVVQALKLGLPLREIAKMNSVSRSTIDRVCHESPDLYQQWRKARYQMKAKL